MAAQPQPEPRMRSHSVRIGVAGLSLATLAACSHDSTRDLVAPHSPDKLFVYPGGGIIRVVPNPDDFVEITAGSNHTCARKNSGDVYCWGTDNGTMRTPLRVFTGATQIDAGGSHTCALVSSGAAYCWGHGTFGEL